MKNSIYLLLIPLIFSIPVSAQDTTRKTHFGVNLSMASYYSDLAFASPSLQVSRRICTYTVAPLFVLDQKNYKYKTTGVAAYCCLIPKNKSSVIFPMLELGLQYFKARSQPNAKEEVNLNLCLGFGIVAEITKKVALFESFNMVGKKGDGDTWMTRLGLLIQLSK